MGGGAGSAPATPATPRRQLVCVANTHIHANPELNDVKLWQVSTLLKVTIEDWWLASLWATRDDQLPHTPTDAGPGKDCSKRRHPYDCGR